jgi:hypothetical protein
MGMYVSVFKGIKYTVAARSSSALEPTTDNNESVKTMPLLRNILHENRQLMTLLYCRFGELARLLLKTGVITR